MFGIDNVNIDEKLGELEKKYGIPKKRLFEVYNKLFERIKIQIKDQEIPIGRKKFIAFFHLRHAIEEGYPVAFCPLCEFHDHWFSQLRSHLRDDHDWGDEDLEEVRKGFFAAKDKKRLDYTPKLPQARFKQAPDY